MNNRIPLLLAAFCLWPGLVPATPVYDYKVLDKMPQSRANYVQGLEIHDNQLYVSTGHYGQSYLHRYRLPDGLRLDSVKLHPRLFGEGVTVLDDRIYQLTWRSRRGAIYDRASLQQQAWFSIPGEGWGITNNGSELIYSDGSNLLHFLSPRTLQRKRSLAVTDNGKPLRRLNELEWIEGKIWANVWQTDRIVIIDPESGEVTASIDLTGLLPESERLPGSNPRDEVLNGIARDPADGSIWVTGKRWPWLYKIELLPRESTRQGSNRDPVTGYTGALNQGQHP
jgi:glutamine cyclotransferase